MLNRNDKKEIAGKLKALFPKASNSGREQLLNLLVNCCCIDLCSINSNADDIQFTGLTLLGNTLSLTLTINGVPTTQVVTLPTQVSTTLVNNGDGSFTYINEANVPVTISISTLLTDAGISDGFVNNNDGTLTHAAIDGTVVTFDINDLLLTTTPLFTVNAGTTSVSTDASLGSQVITYGDILHFWSSNGSINFNVQAGSVITEINTEADIIPYTPTTLVSTNVGDALDELASESHTPTTLTNNAAAFSWNSGTQTGNIPLTPTLVDNGDGTITYNPNNGAAPITIDVTENANEVLTTTAITVNGTTYPANTSVQAILSAISAYAGTTNLTYTPSATNGTIVSDTGTDAVIPSVTLTNAGLATPTMFTNSHVPVTTVAGSVTIGLSGTDNQTLKADITGIDTATAGQIPSTDGAGNVVWTTPTSSTADNGLTETLGNIQLGGTLIQDTVIDQAGFKLDVYNNTSGITTHITQTDTFLGLPVAGVGTAATDAGNMTAYQFSGDFGGVLRNQIGVQDFTGADTHNTSIQQNAVAGNTYTKIVSTDGASSAYSQLQVKENSTEIIANDGTNVNTVTIEADKLIVSQYPNTRDDSGVTPPINFLYTNGSGDFLSAPTSGIVANEWHTTGNAGTDGGTTNFVGTTDAQDLVLKTNGVEIAKYLQNGNIVLNDAFNNISSGNNSLATGQETEASGFASFSANYQSYATGYASSAFNQATSSGVTAFAANLGFASGGNSTSFGEGCVSLGANSFTNGIYNTAASISETVIGAYNTNYVGNLTTWIPTDRLFTIGNGTTDAARNNALTLWKDGRSMWNGDVAKQNTWIGVNGTNAQNFINVTTPTGALAAISTEHTTSGNYAVLGSNNGNSGLVINNTRQFAFTTTAGTTSTQLGATTTVANYSNTGFLFGGGGVAISTVDISGTLGLSNTRINTANPVLSLNNTVYHFIGGASGTVNMAVMLADNRTFVLTNYSGVSLTLSNSVRIGSAVTTTILSDNTSMTIAYDGTEFFKIA